MVFIKNILLRYEQSDWDKAVNFFKRDIPMEGNYTNYSFCGNSFSLLIKASIANP